MGKSRRRGRNHERLDIEELQKKLELDRTRQIASGGKIAKSTTEDNLLQIEESSHTVMPKVKDKKKENFLQVEKLERVITVKAQKNQYEEFCHSIQGAIHRQKASRAVCCFQLAFGGDGMLKAGFISHDMAVLCCRAFAERHGREFYLYDDIRAAWEEEIDAHDVMRREDVLLEANTKENISYGENISCQDTPRYLLLCQVENIQATVAEFFDYSFLSECCQLLNTRWQSQRKYFAVELKNGAYEALGGSSLPESEWFTTNAVKPLALARPLKNS